MAKKPNFLKNLLTTASALAVVAGAANAYATSVISVADPANFSTGVNFNSNGAAVAGGIAAGTNVISGGAYGLTLNQPGAFGSLNLYGNNTNVTVTSASSFTSIVNVVDDAAKALAATAKGKAVNPGQTQAAKANFEIGLNGDFTFNAVDALGTIKFTDANAKATFATDNSEVKGTIDGNGGNHGKIIVNAVNVTFSAAIGATQKINEFTVNDQKSATLNANLSTNGNITLGSGAQGGVLNVGKGKNITSAAGGIEGSADKKGVLNFSGDSVITTAVNKGIGATVALEEINIGAGTVQLTTGDKIKAAKINFTDAAAALKLNTVNTAVTGDVLTTVDRKGKVILGAAAPVFTGNIGAADMAIEGIDFGAQTATFQQTGAKDLSINASNFTGTATAEAAFKVDKGQNIIINTNIGTSSVAFNEVSISDNNDTGAITATLAEGRTINTKTFDIAAEDQNNILVLTEGSAIKGQINPSNANKGIIKVTGNSTVTNINGGNAIDQIQFTVAGKKLTVEAGDAINVNNANGIDFQADGILEYTGTGNFEIGEAIKVAESASGTGSIIVNKSTNIISKIEFGNIGDPTVANKSLKLLQVTGGTTINLGNSASIKKVDIGSADAVLALGGKNSVVLIEEFAHGNEKGILVVSEDNITLKAGSSFSTEKNRLKQVNFGGDHELVIENGVNLYTKLGFFNTGTDNKGKLKFTGSSVIGGIVGANNTFDEIKITGKNSLVEFENAVKLDNNVTISDTATAQFDDAINVGEVNGENAGQGTLSIVNSKAITTKAGIGSTNKLAAVELGGTDVTFSSADFKTNNLRFSNIDGATTATFNKLANDEFQNTKITTLSTKKNHNIVLTKGTDNQFDQEVGSAANQLGTFTMVYDTTAGGKDSTININTDFYGSIATDTKQKGTVNFVKNNSLVLNVGSATNEVLDTNFKSSGTVKGDIYSKNITVFTNQTATFEGMVTSSASTVLEDGSSAVFADGSTLNSTINGRADGNGSVTFTGNATINKAIGGTRVNNIVINGAGKTAKLGAKLSGNTISISNGATAMATNDIELNGATTISASTLDLSDSDVTFMGGAASQFTGASNLKVTVTDENDGFGQVIVSGAGTVLSLDNASVINLTVNDTKSELPSTEEGETFTLFVVNNGATLTDTAGKIKVSGALNRFVQWSYADKVLTRKNIAASALSNAVSSIKDSSLIADALALGNMKNTGDAQSVVSDFARIADDTTLADAVRRLSKPIETNSAVMVNVASAGKQVVNNRLGVLSPTPGIQVSDINKSGVSAGDEAKFGAWVSPFLSQNNQTAYKGSAGYRATSFGATIGFDTMVNADMTLGLAGTYAKTNVKHKNFKAGDKTKADTFMFSIYGIQQITNEWFLQAVASFSSSKVKNSEKRITSSGIQRAKGSFDTTTYGGDAMLGYNYNMSGATLTPLLGVNFTRINDGGYKETGTDKQNLTITKKAVNKFELVGGIRAQMSASNMNGIEVTPEIHGFVKHDLIGKNPNITAKLDGLATPFTPKSAKAVKTSFNVGLGVNAVSGMYEYGAGYDLNIANKFVGHQGTLKVRINF